MKKVTGIYVNAEKHTASPVEVEDTLEGYYKLLDVTTIDIVSIEIAGKYFDVICDDEGLLKEDPTVTAVDVTTGGPLLVGNLFICSHDQEGNQKSITAKDVMRILGAFEPVIYRLDVVPMLFGRY